MLQSVSFARTKIGRRKWPSPAIGKITHPLENLFFGMPFAGLSFFDGGLYLLEKFGPAANVAGHGFVDDERAGAAGNAREFVDFLPHLDGQTN